MAPSSFGSHVCVCVRVCADKGKGWSQQGSKLDLGQLLQPHRGFDRLALDDTASEGSESDVEEYHAPAARKA